MDIFDKIKDLEILTVLDSAGIAYKKDSGQMHTYTLLKDDWTLNNSFKVSTSKNIAKDFGWDGIEGWPFDFIGRYLLKVDTQSTVGKATTVKWFIEKGLVEAPDQKKEFVKSLSNQELLDQFDSFKLGGYKKEISSLLLKRWVSSDFISKNTNKIWEVFKDIGYYENYFCTEHLTTKDEEWNWHNEEWDEPKSVPVFLFPCYDGSTEVKNLIWIKVRRKDGKTIRGKKSLAIWKTGLMYNSINKKTSIIVEWEMDGIILEIMGYKGVIANCGWVQSSRQYLKSLLYETDKIICLYDNDIAGESGKIALAETVGRPIHTIEYPIREDRNGNTLSDVNDFYKVGYDTKTKWDKIFSETIIVGGGEKRKDSRFVILDKHLEIYDTKYKKYQKTDNVISMLWVTKKELFKSDMPVYEDLCYRALGKEWFYNTLDESKIVSHGWDEEPILHEGIEKLILNISGNKKKNAQWIHKSILFKLTHLNEVLVPALILYGTGWSGKWAFLTLLSKIFWDDNTQVGLGQKDLESWFDSYQWNKLIVEFKEVSSGNKHNDKKILDKIKSFVWEPKISVRALHKDSREVENIARFHLSSNHAVPIQLDSKHSGNRRFTIIKTGGALSKNTADLFWRDAMVKPKAIKQYIAWLYETYPDIPYTTKFEALDNAEKKQLEDACWSSADLFFEWFENKYPHIIKITNVERKYLLDLYCTEIGEDAFDTKYKQSNFDLWLGHRYEKKAIKIRWKTSRGYYINKNDDQLLNMPEGTNWEFWEKELPC